jgi:hypothetical protein
MLTVSCPKCSKPLKALENVVGRKVKCGSCGHVFTHRTSPPSKVDFRPPGPATGSCGTDAPASFPTAADDVSNKLPLNVEWQSRGRFRTPSGLPRILLIAGTCVAVLATGAWLVKSLQSPAAGSGTETHYYARSDYEQNSPPEPVEEHDFTNSPFFVFVPLIVLVGLIWLIMVHEKRRQAKKDATKALEAQKPTHGPVACPFCQTNVAANVRYLGQSILCPSCHGSFTAPDVEAEKKSKARKPQAVSISIGTGLMVFGLIALLQGDAGLLSCVLFGFGVGLLVRGFFGAVNRPPE